MVKVQIDAATGRGAIEARIKELLGEWEAKKHKALLQMKRDAALEHVPLASLDPAKYGLGSGSDPTRALDNSQIHQRERVYMEMSVAAQSLVDLISSITLHPQRRLSEEEKEASKLSSSSSMHVAKHSAKHLSSSSTPSLPVVPPSVHMTALQKYFADKNKVREMKVDIRDAEQIVKKMLASKKKEKVVYAGDLAKETKMKMNTEKVLDNGQGPPLYNSLLHLNKVGKRSQYPPPPSLSMHLC
jgi:hypothetical protein